MIKLRGVWKTNLSFLIGVIVPTIAGWGLLSPTIFLVSLGSLFAGAISWELYRTGGKDD